MRRLLVTILLAAIPSTLEAARSAEGTPIVLAQDGKARATIVVQHKGKKRLHQAAEELQRYIEKICGVEIPIKADGKKVKGTGLYIGGTVVLTPEEHDPRLRDDRYAVRVRDGSVMLTGRFTSSAYFAVMGFIERDLGVRWFAPGELWEYVPQSRPGELTVHVKDRQVVPDLRTRFWAGHDWTDEWKQWNWHNRVSSRGLRSRYAYSSRAEAFLPSEEYGNAHPEYYPLLLNGRRHIPPKGRRPKLSERFRPCQSNREVVLTIAKYLRTWFDSHPVEDCQPVGISDVRHFCACGHCRKMDPSRESYGLREFSDRHYAFVNAIARDVARTHPDKYLGVLMYNVTKGPPVTSKDMEPNVYGFICQNAGLWFLPGREKEEVERSREWARRVKHISRYEYYGLGCFTPRVYPHAMDRHIKLDRELGIEGVYAEIFAFLPHTAPMMWALNKLQWDGSRDVDALLDEFYTKLFGASAGTIGEYYALLERSWNTPRPGRNFWVTRDVRRQCLAMSLADIDASDARLRRADKEAAKEPEAVRKRIEILAAAFEYSALGIKTYRLSEELLALRVRSTRDVDAMTRKLQEYQRLLTKRDASWTAARAREDILGDSVRGLEGMRYLMTSNFDVVDNGMVQASLLLARWMAKNAPQKLTRAIERMEKTAPRVAEAMNAQRAVILKGIPDIAQNGSFEVRTPKKTDGAESPAHREVPFDWDASRAFRRWRFWVSRDRSRPQYTPTGGRKGSAGASIIGEDKSCYIQGYSAQPGDEFICSAWVKATVPEAAYAAQVWVRFQDEKGRLIDPSAKRPVPDVVNAIITDEWQRLIIHAIAPDRTGAMSLLLMSHYPQPEPDGTITFDDVKVYRIAAGTTGSSNERANRSYFGAGTSTKW